MELNGKVALITGGGKGIGKAISRHFVNAGADLIIFARTREPLNDMAREAAALERKVLVAQGDGSVENDVKDAVKQGLDTFGKIDILVNNTGIEGPNAHITDISLKDWEQTMAVNLSSAFLFCKYVIPSMVQRESGCIINISSLAGTKGIIARSPYCASKWGIIGMSRAVAEEVGPDGIRVNVICPGAVAGERFDRVVKKRAHDYGVSFEEMIETTTKATPLRRYVTENEIAKTALFLASDAASGITGEEIVVSGGRR